MNDKIYFFKEELLKYREKINIMSKNTTNEQLDLLIKETLLINNYTDKYKYIYDVGSGNGILGIPIALLNPEKKVFLIDTSLKKTTFLSYIKKKIKISNIEIIRDEACSYIKKNKKQKAALISRGFPKNTLLIDLLVKKHINFITLITSKEKALQYRYKYNNLIFVEKKIPLRDKIEILTIRRVSRET